MTILTVNKGANLSHRFILGNRLNFLDTGTTECFNYNESIYQSSKIMADDIKT